VYNHIFLTIGNGYSWDDNGNLTCCEDLSSSVNDAVHNAVSENFSSLDRLTKLIIDHFSLTNRDDSNVEHLTNSLEDLCAKYRSSLIAQIGTILDIDALENDVSIADDFHFYPISKYSIIANIPDNVEHSILTHINDFISILENNLTLVRDDDDLLPKIKDRVNSLLNTKQNSFFNSLLV
jgi:hypothetical protein